MNNLTSGDAVDPRDQAHLYTQVSEFIRDQIEAGKLQAGDAIWPQRELSKLCNVSEITVRRAVRDLVEEGVLVARRGSGTYVTGDPPRLTDTRRLTARTPAAAPAVRHQIGLVVVDFGVGYPFMQVAIAGVRQQLGPQHVVQIAECPPDPKSRDSVNPERLLQQGFTGLLMMSPSSVPLIAACQRAKLPYVLLYNDLSDGVSRCIYIDYSSGLLDAVQHLTERGKERIGLIAASATRTSSGRIACGYRMALRHFGLTFQDHWLHHTGYGESEGYEAAIAMLQTDEDDKPNAILCASDYQAKGVLLAAQELGIDVPGDLAIVGMGNVLRPKETSLQLTTIDTQLVEMAGRAANILQRLINGDEHTPMRDIVVPTLRVGEST